MAFEPWPEFDESKIVEDTVEIAVQINGKTKAVIEIAKDIDKDSALAQGKEAVNINGDIVKEIFVPGRIINFVVK